MVFRFSTEAATQRQSTYAREWGEKRVGTPTVIVNGDRWASPRKVQRLHKKKEKTGEIKLIVNSPTDIQIEYVHPTAFKKKLYGTVALLGNGYQGTTPFGPNKNKRMEHDFVVIASDDFQFQKKSKVKFSFPYSFAEKKIKDKPKDYSIAVWVWTVNSRLPMQAVGGNLGKNFL